ncbi:MAG: hypothetical protein ACLQJR_05150 [Stellaceae bacterium]
MKAVSRLLEASDTASRPPGRRPTVAAATLIVLAAVMSLLLGGCHDAHPLYGPDTPRDGTGRPVDPIYGTPIPGTGNYGL